MDPAIKLSKGVVIKGKWKIVRMLGEGGCGVVYEVTYDKDKIGALKAESLSARKEDEILKMEVHVLRKLQGKAHVCQLLGCGRTETFNYIVMTLLGTNLAELRRVCPEQRFTTSTSLRLGFQSLNAIKDVHSVGYVHRDVKPSNFALGGTDKTKRTVFVLDFGLARVFETNDSGKRQLREPRQDVAFRGTIRYCSVNVHRRMEQGRHDDLWSFLYMMIEMLRGQLPWRNKGKEGSKEAKSNITDKALIDKCPAEFLNIVKHLRGLTYFKAPDYQLIEKQLKTLMTRNKYTNSDPFDWEQGGKYHSFFLHADDTTSTERTDSQVMKRDTDSAPDTIQDADDLDQEPDQFPDSGKEDTRKDLSDIPSDVGPGNTKAKKK